MAKKKTPERGADYSKKKFSSFNSAYNTYRKRRLAAGPNAAISPRDKFKKIWGW